MRSIFPLLLCITLCAGAVAQSATDSLRAKLKSTTDAREKALLITQLGKALFTAAQYDSLTKYGEQLYQLASELKDKDLLLFAQVLKAQSFMRTDSSAFFTQSKTVLKACEERRYVPGIAITCLGVGSRLMNLGRYREARQYLLAGYSAIDSTQQEWIGIKSDLIRTVSAVYHHQGLYSEALEYGLISNRLAEQSKEPMQTLKAYLNLSGLYGELSSPENGLGTADDRARYHREAKKYMRLSYTFSISNASKMTQGATAFNLGSLYGEGKQPDSAFLYLNIAIRLGHETGFYELLSNAYRAKGKLHTNDADSSLWFFDQASAYAEKAKNPITVVGTAVDKARVLFTRGDLPAAEKLAREALQQTRELKLLNEKRSALHVLYEIQQKRNNHKEALELYQQFVSVRDSMINEKNFAKIEELKTRYETELKDTEIKSLEQRAELQDLELKQRSLLLLLVLLLAFVFSTSLYLFFRQRALRQRQEALQLENKFLRFQLDPHFISNALVSIQRFMLENNAQDAAHYLSKFARLMRQLLEYSREELITLEEEIDLLKNYLDLQKLRLKEKFEYTLHIDEQLSLSDSRISPMFAQPFVENAVEHGISSTYYGKITIEFLKQEGQLIVVITDNGKGVSLNETTTKTSLSTKIIRERIALLNKTNRFPIELTVGTSPTGNGTQVKLTLPIYS